MKDALGRELQVGDLIVWPFGYGAHSIGVRSGRVIQVVGSRGLRVQPTDDAKDCPRKFTNGTFLHKIQNVVKVGPCPTAPAKYATCARCGGATLPVEWGCPECGPWP